jgi:hypothetical protein
MFVLLASMSGVLIARRAEPVTPTSDTAVIETFTILASRGRLLLGPYSRFQWHHPGPMSFYGMAPFYAASGGRTAGLNAGALALTLLSLFVAMRILVRHASRALATTASAACTLLVWRVPDLLTSPWNAHVPVIALLALLVAAAEAMCGGTAALVTVGIFASLTSQTHVALLPLSVTVIAASTFGFVLATRRAPNGTARSVGGLLTMTMVLAVAWAPSLLEALLHRGGNLRMVWTYFVAESRPGQPFGMALSAWADMLVGPLRPDFYLAHGWPFVESPVRWAEGLACAELLLVAAAMVTWRAAGRRFDASLAAVVLGASLVSLWSMTRIDGQIFDHAAFWMTAIGALNLAVASAFLLTSAARWRVQAVGGEPRAWVAMLACAACVAIAAVLGLRELRGVVAASRTPNVESRAAQATADDLAELFRSRGISRPLVRFDQDAWGMVAGVVLRLQKQGIPVAVEDDWMAMFTPDFAATGHEAASVAIVGQAEHVRLSARPGNRVVASHDPLFAHLFAP